MHRPTLVNPALITSFAGLVTALLETGAAWYLIEFKGSPQNLSVGAAGVGAVGREGEIFAKVILHSLVLTTLMGLVAMLQAYVVPWMVPTL